MCAQSDQGLSAHPYCQTAKKTGMQDRASGHEREHREFVSSLHPAHTLVIKEDTWQGWYVQQHPPALYGQISVL